VASRASAAPISFVTRPVTRNASQTAAPLAAQRHADAVAALLEAGAHVLEDELFAPALDPDVDRAPAGGVDAVGDLVRLDRAAVDREDPVAGLQAGPRCR
jgi:hypothetical protein